MRNWIVFSIVGLGIVAALLYFVGAGLTVMAVAVVLPYALIAFALREECNRACSDCVADYLSTLR